MYPKPAACCLLSLAQRRLSTPVRQLRRRTLEVSGEQRLADGTVLPLDSVRLAAPLEGALSALWLALVVLAVGLLVARLEAGGPAVDRGGSWYHIWR